MTRALTLALPLVLVTVTSCGDDDGSSDEAAADGSGGAGDFEPVTVTDCNGTEARVEAPPERVVTLTSPVLEMLFWLGVEDRVIGTGTPPEPGDFPPEFEEEGLEVPKLSGEYEAGAYQPVPREILIGNDPDFVLGGFTSNFDAEQGGASQDDLAERGIPSYLAFSLSCSSAQTGPQEDLSLTQADFENLGQVFGVEDRAQDLIDEMQSTVDAVQEQVGQLPDDERPSVFAFEAEELAEGDQSPYAPGNRQTINAVINLAGGRNIFDDLDTDYERVGWESVIERDPDVILLITYAKEDEAADEAAVQDAEDFLTNDERTRNMRAVQEGNFVHLLYEEGSAGGFRNAEAVESLARQLHPDLFPQEETEAGESDGASGESSGAAGSEEGSGG